MSLIATVTGTLITVYCQGEIDAAEWDAKMLELGIADENIDIMDYQMDDRCVVIKMQRVHANIPA